MCVGQSGAGHETEEADDQDDRREHLGDQKQLGEECDTWEPKPRQRIAPAGTARAKLRTVAPAATMMLFVMYWNSGAVVHTSTKFSQAHVCGSQVGGYRKILSPRAKRCRQHVGEREDRDHQDDHQEDHECPVGEPMLVLHDAVFRPRSRVANEKPMVNTMSAKTVSTAIAAAGPN